MPAPYYSMFFSQTLVAPSKKMERQIGELKNAKKSLIQER